MRPAVAIPRPSLSRLPLYYRRLVRAIENDEPVISSRELGLAASVPAAQVRKDLSHLGELGRAGIGYEVRDLAAVLQQFLGLSHAKDAILVGVGNLGRALAGYPGFTRYGLRIVALFDKDPAVIGSSIADQPVRPISDLSALVRAQQIHLGIITVPANQAQAVCDLMVDAGIDTVWNFAPHSLIVPTHVVLENEDLAARLATLSYHIMRQTPPGEADKTDIEQPTVPG